MWRNGTYMSVEHFKKYYWTIHFYRLPLKNKGSCVCLTPWTFLIKTADMIHCMYKYNRLTIGVNSRWLPQPTDLSKHSFTDIMLNCCIIEAESSQVHTPSAIHCAKYCFCLTTVFHSCLSLSKIYEALEVINFTFIGGHS